MRRLLLVLAFMGAAAWLVLDRVQRIWEEPLVVPDGGYEVYIERGSTLRGILAELHAAGIVHYPRMISLYGRYSGLDQRIRRGEYLLEPGLDAEGLLLLLTSGRVISYQVTLPEGLTLAQAIDVLADARRLKTTLSGQTDPRILDLIEPRLAPEGLFFPDSYQYERGDSDWDMYSSEGSNEWTLLVS